MLARQVVLRMRRIERHFERLIAAGVRDMAGALAFRAAERPDAVAALLLEDGERPGERVTYAALLADARRIATALRRRTSDGARVVLAFPTGVAFLTALFGCFFAGRIAVPAPPPRGALGAARLTAIAADCSASTVLTTSAVRAAATIPSALLCPDEFADEGDDATVVVDPEALALLQYTSGSTGAPKGVAISHRAIWHNQSVIRTCFDHSEGVVLVGWLPNFHDMGLIGNLLQPIYAGGLSVMMAPNVFVQRPLRWLRAIARHGAHTSGGPNFAYDLCVKAAAVADLDDLDLSCWRVAFNGAEPIRKTTLDAFAARFAPHGFRRSALMACYGLAESTLMVTGTSVDEGVKTLRASAQQIASGALSAAQDGERGVDVVSCGEPVAGADLLVVDAEAGALREPGCVGEVVVCSDSVCDGYWGRPEDGPFIAIEGRRYLRTGDLGAVRDGILYIVGRAKDVLIVNGRNVHPKDIEAAIEDGLRAQGVQRALAAAPLEQPSEAPFVFVEIARAALKGLDAARLMAEVRRLAAEAAEIAPVGVVLLKPGALPLTSSGKVRRRACAERFAAGALAGVVQMDAGAARLADAGLAGGPHSR